jgi:HPt (histidine-containing phosphotransfer) domain-containing protein
MSDAPVLDARVIDQLRQLEDHSGHGFVQQVLELFLKSLDVRVTKIAAAVVSGDARHVEEEAHALKGVSAQVGAARLSAVCGVLEAAGKSGDLSASAPHVELLQTTARQTREALSEVA